MRPVAVPELLGLRRAPPAVPADAQSSRGHGGHGQRARGRYLDQFSAWHGLLMQLHLAGEPARPASAEAAMLTPCWRVSARR